MFVMTNLSYRWGGEGVRVSLKKNFSWIPFSLKYQCKKKLPLRPKASARYLTCMTTKHSFKAKEGTCSAEEGIFPRSRFIYWLVSSGRPLDDFNLLVYTNNFNYMSKKNLIKLQTLYFFRFLHVFQLYSKSASESGDEVLWTKPNCSRPSRPCIVG